jgi:hypothetical protein
MSKHFGAHNLTTKYRFSIDLDRRDSTKLVPFRTGLESRPDFSGIAWSFRDSRSPFLARCAFAKALFLLSDLPEFMIDLVRIIGGAATLLRLKRPDAALQYLDDVLQLSNARHEARPVSFSSLSGIVPSGALSLEVLQTFSELCGFH